MAHKKSLTNGQAFFMVSFLQTALLLLVLGVTRTELVDSTCRVHKCILTSVEGVACRADFHLDDGVLIAIIPLLRLFAFSTALPEEAPVRCQVLKNDSAVVIGVDSFFHRRQYRRQKYDGNSNPTTAIRGQFSTYAALHNLPETR